MEVNMLSRKMIKPKNPTANHLRSSKSSLFDQLQAPVHIPSIYFYPYSNTVTISDKLNRLQTSLSETLSCFYPVAGRFSIDGLCVNCNDQGVEYLEAQVVNVTLSQFVSEAQENLDLLDSLVPWDIQKPTLEITPILGIQVTVFKCGGLAICGCYSHLLYDGFSGSTFFHQWSVACRAGIDQVKVPDFSVASIFPSRDLSGMIKPLSSSSIDKNIIKIIRKRFLFPEKTIARLKSQVRAKSGNVINPTRVDVIASAIWKVLISIDQAKHGSFLKDSTLCTSLNLRGRTGIEAIPKNVIGNFYFQIPNRFKWTKTEDLELHHLVNLFRNTIKNELVECSEISNPNELVMKVAKNTNGMREDMENEGVDFRFLTSFCKFPMYEVDFGWGKPEWIACVKVPVDSVVLVDTKCGTNIEAIVSLGELDMRGFENHPDIVAFTSEH